jgi:hypothetical protein
LAADCDLISAVSSETDEDVDDDDDDEDDDVDDDDVDDDEAVLAEVSVCPPDSCCLQM